MATERGLLDVAVSWQSASLVGVLVAASVFDWRFRRIPNQLILAGMVLALCFALIKPEPGSLMRAGLGGVAGLALFLPLYAVRWVGAGDAKLVAVVGLFTGPVDVLWIALATFVSGGALACFLLLLHGGWRSTSTKVLDLFRALAFRLRGAPVPLVVQEGPQSLRLPYALAIFGGVLIWHWQTGRLSLPAMVFA
jgi:prepilin peptidase CpaA